MTTTSIAATPQFVAGSSRGPRRLDTLRAQMASEMADLERGERIRELREARRLTQPAVWERMCAVGGPKPNGKPFISFRMYQRYEEGRGISWEKLRVLAEVLDAGEDYILRGEGERRQPRPARSVDATSRSGSLPSRTAWSASATSRRSAELWTASTRPAGARGRQSVSRSRRYSRGRTELLEAHRARYAACARRCRQTRRECRGGWPSASSRASTSATSGRKARAEAHPEGIRSRPCLRPASTALRPSRSRSTSIPGSLIAAPLLLAIQSSPPDGPRT
jgi:transcriptional regulator with XRE-family HTH domain